MSRIKIYSTKKYKDINKKSFRGDDAIKIKEGVLPGMPFKIQRALYIKIPESPNASKG
jgi:hypothetical protein